VVNDPAALPLLQFTLSQLWQRRRRNRITREAYAEIGRPAEALGRTAEKVYENLRTEQAHAAARDIFLALVVPAVGAEFVRRRVRRGTLHDLRDSTQIDRVLDAFVAAGLIRKTVVEAGDDRFDVMHEALLRNWPRLIGWLDEVREKDSKKLLVLNRARIWDESGREPDHLAVGAALEETAEFAAADPLILSYVEASRARAQVLHKKSRRRKIVIAAAILVLAGAGIISNLLGHHWSQQALSNLTEVQELALNQIVAQAEDPQTGLPDAPLIRVLRGPGSSGLIRIGLAQQSFLRSAEGQDVVAPTDVHRDGFYRLRIDVPLVEVASSGDNQVRVRANGNASAGALVVARGTASSTDRPSGRQYWLPVRVVPRVFVQFSGGTREQVTEILRRLRERGFDVPAAQQVDAVPEGAEVRYYYNQDEASARYLVMVLNSQLPTRPTRRLIKSGGTRANQGSLEVWLNLSPTRN
jgi:hypothetical protein